MNTNRASLLERLQTEAADLLGETPTLFAYGIADPDRFPLLLDLHLAAYMDPNLPPESYFHVEVRLETLLEEMLAVPVVGIRILNGTPLTFRGAVLTAGRIVCSRDERARVAFEVHTWTRYFDLKRMLLGDHPPPEEDPVTLFKDATLEKLGHLEEFIGRLRHMAETAGTDPVIEDAVRYALQRAITCCVSICLELVAVMKLRPPRDAADIPEVLAEVGLLDASGARNLVSLIAIRDRLIHDPEGDFASLRAGLSDHVQSLTRFAEAIRKKVSSE